MENEKIMECSTMEEVREMRRKISAEFGHDLNRLVTYYQEVENEMRKSGRYKFVDMSSEKPESEKGVFDSLVSVRLVPEKFEVIKTLTKSLEYFLET